MLTALKRLFGRAEWRAGRKYACCRLARNMRPADSGRADVTLEICVCGRRHFVARADPGALGTRGAVMGGR